MAVFNDNLSDQFIVVSDTNPTTQLFQTQSVNAFVANNVAAYDTWLASSFGFNTVVSAVADNGSGLVRLTVADASNLATGQRWMIANVSTDADGIRTITKINATTVDLQGSTYTGAAFNPNPALTPRLQGALILPTAVSLWAAINNFNALVPRLGSQNLSPSGSTNLTNPLAAVVNLAPTVGVNVFLPIGRATYAPAIGVPTEVRNDSNFLVHLFTSAAVDLGVMAPRSSLTLRLTDNTTQDGSWQETFGFSITPYQKSRVSQLSAVNNAGTPNTKMDVAATWAIHGNQNIGAPWIFTTGAATCDVGLAGPAANGRDQAGAFGPNTFIHFFSITRASDNNTSHFTTLASQSFVNPILPTGYTHQCYLFSCYFDGGNHLLPVTVWGDSVAFTVASVTGIILTAGASTTASAMLLTSTVPTQAGSYRLLISLTTTNANTFTLRYSSGNNFISVPVPAAGRVVFELTVPNTGLVQYLWGVATGSADVTVLSYTMPNGDN